MTYNIDVINGTSLDVTLVGMSQQATWLFPTILAFIFCVISISGIAVQSRRIGFSNVPMWFSIAGLTVSTMSFMLFAVDQLINIWVLTTVLAVTFGSVLWWFFSDMGSDF